MAAAKTARRRSRLATGIYWQSMSYALPLHAPTAEQLELRQRFRAGDRQAFEQLARPQLDLLHTLCLRMVNDHSQAEDLSQLTLERALKNHHRFDPERSFRPWLLAIAGNLCRDRLRTVWWRRVVALVRDERSHQQTPESLTDAAKRDLQVRTALATLPPHYREAVALFHLQDLSYLEMAEITGVSVAALKQRVRRGCAMLAEAVKRLYPELVEGRNQ